MNKIANKVITLIMSIIMVLAFMPDMSNVWAATPNYKQKAVDISMDQEYNIRLNEEDYNIYHITPSTDGTYKASITNFSSRTAEPYAAVYEYDTESDAYEKIARKIVDGPCDELSVIFTGKAGKDYYITLISAFGYLDCTLQVKEDNSIKSIEYITTEKTTYKENDERCGHWAEDDGGNKYFHYDIPPFYNGDKLIVTTDAGEKVFTFDISRDRFVSGSEYYSINDPMGVRINDKQRKQHWGLGKENYYTISMPSIASSFESIPVGVEVISNVKANNPMKASGKTVKVSYKKLKKSTQKIKASSAFKISGAKGKVSFKMYKKNKKAGKKISVASNGVITVKKGLKKGKYKFSVKVHAAGNLDYKSSTKTVYVTVKVA